jgi:DNA-binding NtrC family response regulator
VIERAVLLCGDGAIEPGHLSIERPAAPPEPPDELRRIHDALRRAAGNQTAAASLLGISRRTLIHRLDEYHLPRPVKGRR